MSKKVLAALLAVCMVASLLFVPAAAATFNDVDEDHWASGAIERWAGYGVLNGKDAEAGIFDPSAPMTRAEFAKMLVEMLGLTAKSEATFDDVDPDAWYAEVVSIAVKAGIINGRTAEKFEPNEPVTFEEAAVMMCRAFGLAQVTSGSEWAKESIEKLTSLGMIGEGADEHLQVGVDCDRAVVAALADAVVKEYVNEDREEPITGEVNGVVLVVKGAKVEIKDATVSAPIVVESAEVTLTGTKAEDVKVSGKDAAIVADEASTVASVTLAGEAPKADIKGEVASVTIAEETTGAVVDAPKADPDTIVNNSTEEATVNGETVEGKPEETTDPTEPEGPGSVNGNDGPEAPPRTPADKTEGSSGDKVTDDREPENVGDAPEDTSDLVPGKDENGDDKEMCADDAHNWDKEVTNPTCTATGSVKYTCSKCGANKTETIEAAGHEFTRTGFNTTQHYKLCKYCDTQDSATNHTLEYAQAGTKHTATCTGCDYTKSEAHTAKNDTWVNTDADTHWKVCACGAKVDEAAHDWEDDADDANKEVCSVCGAERTKETDEPQAHDGACEATGGWIDGANGVRYKACSKKLSDGTTPCPLHVEEHTCAEHSKDASKNKGATCLEAGWENATECETCGNELNAGSEIAQKAHDYSGEGGKCVNGCNKTQAENEAGSR